MKIADIIAMGFTKTHSLVLDAGRLRFRAAGAQPPSSAASVYAWVLTTSGPDAPEAEVLYVGKAGRGISARCRQHEGGFSGNSVTGRANKDEICDILADNENANISVYTRVSDTQDIWGKKVSLYSAEEDALCLLLKPRLNRAAFPEVRSLHGLCSIS